MTFLDAFPAFDPTAAIQVSLAAGVAGISLGLAILLCEPRAPTTRAQAATMALTAIALVAIIVASASRSDHWLLWSLVYLPTAEAAVLLAVIIWLVAIARAAQPTRRAMRWIYACAALMVIFLARYCYLSVQAPLERFDHFFYCLGLPEGCGGPVFWRYALPLMSVAAFTVIPLGIVFTQRVDPAERVRAISLAASVPFMYASYFLPMGYGPYAFLLGYGIVTWGTMRYFSLRGERGVLMSRFLSPEVARLVRDKGLDYAVKPQSLEITVVNCDLRGFTRFSQLVASDQVVRMLTEYYDAVGKVVAEFGATIKDYAGDGVLILVGAPLPVEDHAQKGLALAQRIREVGTEFIRHWAGPESRLGIGIGVASGKVTVGAAGSEARLEYTAVGPAVNLAARLCEQAGDGEILVDARTQELAGAESLKERGTIEAKGFGEVPLYALPAGV